MWKDHLRGRHGRIYWNLSMQAEQWKLIGNAVSVDVARWIGQCLWSPLRYKYAAGAQDYPFKKAELEKCPEESEEYHECEVIDLIYLGYSQQYMIEIGCSLIGSDLKSTDQSLVHAAHLWGHSIILGRKEDFCLLTSSTFQGYLIPYVSFSW